MHDSDLAIIGDLVGGYKWFVTPRTKNAVYQLLMSRNFYKGKFEGAQEDLAHLEDVTETDKKTILEMEETIDSLEKERNELAVKKNLFYNQLERQNEAIKTLANIAGV